MENNTSHNSGEHKSSHGSHSSSESQSSRKWRSIRRKLRRNRRTIEKIAGIVVVIIAVVLLVIFFGDCDPESENFTSDNGRTRIQVDGKWYEYRDDIETVIGIGIDKYDEDTEDDDTVNLTNEQCDFLLLLVVDKTNKTYNLLHINRDTMTDVQEFGLNGEIIDTVYEQICLAHTYGTGGKDSCRNTVDAASTLLYETPIDHYVAFTMDVVPIVNDDAGGVTVHIDDDFSNTDPTLVQGSDVTLKGDKALTFVRARSSIVNDQTNLNRMERQRTYLDALRDAATAKMEEDSRWAATTLLDIADYLTTDLTQSDLSYYADVLINYKQSDILTIQGETQVVDDHIQFIPDDDALTQQVLELFYTPVES